MVSSCPNCGVVTPPEARFCRHCGTPLRTGAPFGGNETVSPLAQTVPLSGEGLTTSSLGTDETGRPAPETKRVGQAEINHLLRHARYDAAPGGKNDGDASAAIDYDYAAPPTGELTDKTPAPAAAATPAHPAGRASAAGRTRRLWPRVAVVLLLATLSAALLAYFFLRQRRPSNAVELANEANSNQAVESANTNASVEQAGLSNSNTEQQPEETPQPSPAPSASAEPTRVARAQPEQRESATATPAPAGAQTTPASTPTPLAQATPAQMTTAPPTTPATANSTNSATQAAQASSDEFYFQAVNLVNGRHPRTMPRAELLRALQLFQNVRSGQHAADARRQAAQLGRELDRLNKQSQR